MDTQRLKAPETPAQQEENRDLGFGAVVARESHNRLLNRDGSFNVSRTGLSPLASINLYHALLTIPWWAFFLMVFIGYVVVNMVFALGYYLCGPDALTVPKELLIGNRFWAGFFFSVHTIATIGYGNITPTGLAANILVSLEALVGMLGFALVTGILFARFSRPTAKIIFSETAVIAPYRGISAFEFRITNGRLNQLIELHATVIYAQFEDSKGERIRRFYPLPLERDNVAFFSLTWTVVHPIDEKSPLHGRTQKDLLDAEAEFLILLTGTDETFSQTVHSRSSYRADEVIWDARYANIYNPPTPSGRLTVDVRKLHNVESILKNDKHI